MTAPDHGSTQASTYFRKGFGLKGEVEGTLAADYDGTLVDLLREHDHTLTVEGVTVRLAREFGFCYGVERAVEYAYQTRRKFPDRRIRLVGEIIHNPHVNRRLGEMGIEILEPGQDADGKPVFDYAAVSPEDVVILPAFGVTIADFQLTALIHGKHYHEETRATASQVQRYPNGHYLVVRDMTEALEVCEYIEGRGSRDAFMAKFSRAVSAGFDPDVHLRRIGVANQTTMLARESLAIGEEVGQAMARRYGAEYRAANFRTFDTICSATQDRQDAVLELLAEPLDAMVVIGGYNSSNTISLAALCAEKVATYHVEDATSIDPDAHRIIYRPAGIKHSEASTTGWIPDGDTVRIGLTAGASTPNNKIGETVARIFATRGIDVRVLHA